MKLVQVIPIITVKTLGKLSYFTSLDVNLGDLVGVNINKRKLLAIVVEISNLEDNKLEIRSQDFSLRKIDSIVTAGAINMQIMQLMSEAANYGGTNLATFLSIYLPKDFLNQEQLNIKIKPENYKLTAIELTRRDAIGNIKQIIREKFARDESVLIITPTIISAEKLKDDICGGIEESVFLYHSETSQKNKDKVSKAISSNKKMCLISTPSVIGLYCYNPSTIIIHEEESKYYDHAEEKVNSRNIFYYLAKQLGLEVFLTTKSGSLEAFYLSENEMLLPLLVQNYQNNKISVIKMNHRDKKPYSHYLSYELKLLLDQYVLEKKKIVLYTQRKGISSSSVCADCGESVTCETCDNDLCLFEDTKTGSRMYRCLTCKTKTKIEKEIICKVCSGMRINTLGVGTQGVRDHIENIYGKDNVYILDSDHIKSKKDAIKLYKEFEATGGILIGTEMMLPLLSDIDLISVISLDTYFSLPEYNTDEEIMLTVSSLLSSLNEGGQIIIQTRHKNKLWEFLPQDSLVKYYKYELNNRHEANLPPFTFMISFDLPHEVGTPDFLNDKNFEYYNIKSRDFVRHIYLIPRETWSQDKKLRANVVNLLLEYNLNVNQRSVLKGI